ncbi:hypothetical protein MRX96_003044 [Rhipicephalus microplus]
MESNEDEGTSAADVNRSREPSNDGIQNSDQSNEVTVPTHRQESMQQASQVLPKSSEARTLELEIQKLNLQIQYENLLQARMNAERLNGTLSNSGSETGDQRRRGFDSVQQCAKVLKGFRLPSDADVPLWFEEVEKLFATYQVPHESRVHLVMPALTERVRYLLRNLNPEESADYESVKAAVLTELKLSPAEYLQRFERAVKRKEETWAQFASRVKTYFSYYLQVREADTVEVMAELMVADRIKSGLSTEGLEYVRLREGEGWLRPTEIAKVLQTFEQAKGKGRASKQPTVEMGQKPATRVEKGALKCHLCHGSGHFAKEFPKASDKENNPKKATEPKRKVQKVTLSHETDTKIPTGVFSAKVKSLKHEGEGTDKLQLIPVSCAGISADAILDTGSEITVIRESLLRRSVVEPSGTVRLVSAFGKTIEARLATLPLKLNSPREVTEPQNVDLLCALTDELVEGTDCLLTKDDWKLLLKASSPLAPGRAPAEPAHEAERAVEKQKVVACNLALEEKDDSEEGAQTDGEREASLGQRVEFRNVQLGDTTVRYAVLLCVWVPKPDGNRQEVVLHPAGQAEPYQKKSVVAQNWTERLRTVGDCTTMRVPLVPNSPSLCVTGVTVPASVLSSGGSPTVYVVTPTYRRANQAPDMIKLSQALMLANVPIFWVVVEDADGPSDLVRNIMRRSRLPGVQLSGRTPPQYRRRKYGKGVAPRLRAIEWLRDNALLPSVLYFADDDNSYDHRLFSQVLVWHTKSKAKQVSLKECITWI